MPRTQKCTHIASDKVSWHEMTRKIRSCLGRSQGQTLMAGVSPAVWKKSCLAPIFSPWLIHVFFGCVDPGLIGYCMPPCGVWWCASVLLCAQTLAFRPRYSLSRFGTLASRRFARMSAAEGEAAPPSLTFVTGNAKKLEVRRSWQHSVNSALQRAHCWDAFPFL